MESFLFDIITNISLVGIIVAIIYSLIGQMGRELILSLFKKILSLFRKNKKKQVPDIWGLELLRVISQEYKLEKEKIISIFGSEKNYLALLKGEKELSISLIQKISEHLNIPPKAFFPS